MASISTIDKNKLYTKIKHELGYPLRPFEIEDVMLDSYFEMVIEDYSSLVNSWLIQQQWTGLEGLSKENGDFISAFTTKSSSYMDSFTYAYSKQVGLGANAPAKYGWELKRDFIVISGNTQHYLIPANREINEVLWTVPPQIDLGLVDPYALNAMSPTNTGWSYFGQPAQYMLPTYGTLLGAQDRRMKQRMMQSTLTYRITGLETGEKLLHLYPIPGNRNEIYGKWGKHFEGVKVFYWYYDTNNSNRDECVNDNDDIVKLPSDVLINTLKWEKLNDVAKQQIRDLLIAKVKMVLGSVRGFYGGEIGSAQKTLTMEFRHLLEDGKSLKEATEKNILDQLDKLRQVNLTKERADIAENLNQYLGKVPFMYPIITV